MTLYIQELHGGKIHRRHIDGDGSVRYSAEGGFIIVRDYYSGAQLKKCSIKKYGSVRFWINRYEEDDE